MGRETGILKDRWVTIENLQLSLSLLLARARILCPLLFHILPCFANLVHGFQLTLDFSHRLPTIPPAFLVLPSWRPSRRPTRCGALVSTSLLVRFLRLPNFALIVTAKLVKRFGSDDLLVLPFPATRSESRAAASSLGLRLTDLRQAYAALCLPFVEAARAVCHRQLQTTLGLDEFHVVRAFSGALHEAFLLLVPL